MIALLLQLALAVDPIVPPEVLAPGPDTLDTAVARLEQLLGRADITATDVARSHNALGERFAASKPTCAEADLLALVVRSAPHGQSLRAQVQAARVQLGRVQQISAAPTVEPLTTGILSERMAALAARTTTHERGYLEMAAWHQRWVEPVERRCKAEISALQPTPDPPTSGDPPPAPRPRPDPAP